MAEGYQTEDEQVEALKKWWNENGKSTLATIAIAVAGVFGYQGWQTQQQAEVDAASAIYQNLLAATNGQNGTVTVEQTATANHLADTLKADFPSSTYARFAALYKAKLAVNAEDLAAAEAELRWVLASGPSAEMSVQAKLRLARVLAAQQQYDDALAQLQGDSGTSASAYEEVKGDIYVAQGNSADAALAYQKALELDQQGTNPASNPLLTLKIQQLATQAAPAAQAQPAAAEPAANDSTDKEA
ncbi:YfgM family protein [Oceanicoccus sagamiensis]|uniref:Ancillary SecYEG translocon subunit n=1 Tax=Oceanicoccus sagamiensis TaxID=716816 RepID=A0A1X9NQC6_9GAMM|nr:tetratricopeptide repeat protein [Oceanicoccus sagamiensis]ARN76033.1 hypothetical protein BST96_19195 [Oceanicoccus sagamiensis]